MESIAAIISEGDTPIASATPVSELTFLQDMFPSVGVGVLKDMLEKEPLDRVVARLCRNPKGAQMGSGTANQKGRGSPGKKRKQNGASKKTARAAPTPAPWSKTSSSNNGPSLRDIMQEQAGQQDTTVVAGHPQFSFAARTKQPLPKRNFDGGMEEAAWQTVGERSAAQV